MLGTLRTTGEYKYAGTIEDSECCEQLDLDVDNFSSWFRHRLNFIYNGLNQARHRCTDLSCCHGNGDREGHLLDFTGRRLLWWEPFFKELDRASTLSKNLRSCDTKDEHERSQV